MSDELQQALADRDYEWWAALAVNDAVDATPESVKAWVIAERELAEREAEERGAARERIVAVHAIVSDECRGNRGDLGAWSEASDRLSKEYFALCEAWPNGRGVKLHLLLAVELPEGE